jgi:hypothetical protein
MDLNPHEEGDHELADIHEFVFIQSRTLGRRPTVRFPKKRTRSAGHRREEQRDEDEREALPPGVVVAREVRSRHRLR